jgi:hypothetical protein
MLILCVEAAHAGIIPATFIASTAVTSADLWLQNICIQLSIRSLYEYIYPFYLIFSLDAFSFIELFRTSFGTNKSWNRPLQSCTCTCSIAAAVKCSVDDPTIPTPIRVSRLISTKTGHLFVDWIGSTRFLRVATALRFEIDQLTRMCSQR